VENNQELSEKKPRKKMRRQESIFLKNFGACWKKVGGYWYKIPDAKGFSAQFSAKRPYDVDAAMNQIIFVIEGKHCKTIQFGLNQMEDHQIPALKAAREAGYKAYVLVCYQRLKSKVADFYRIETLLKAELEGRNWLSPEEADLRIYASNLTKWDINPDSISAMIRKTIPSRPDMFEFR
jgi:hypothetical protein